METRSDEDLLALHLAGRSAALPALVSRYTTELFGFLCRFVGDSAMAEDLVQETFLQVHLAGATFDRGRAFKPWLYTIAANKARDALRSRSRRPQLSIDAVIGDSETSAAGSLEAQTAGPDESTDEQVQREQVRQVISRMPEHLRTILILGYYQQLPYAEIAEILSIPVGTVKSRLHAAVGHFARLWQEAAERRPSSAGQRGR